MFGVCFCFWVFGFWSFFFFRFWVRFSLRVLYLICIIWIRVVIVEGIGKKKR